MARARIRARFTGFREADVVHPILLLADNAPEHTTKFFSNVVLLLVNED